MSQPTFKTVSDLKGRLVEGARITLTECSFKHKFLGVPRVIVRHQTNSFAMAEPAAKNEPSLYSWMDWPRAKDFFAIDEDRFRIEFNGRYLIFVIGDRPLADIVPFYSNSQQQGK